MVWQAALVLALGAPDSAAALDSVRSCFAEKAQQYDDGISDAMTIGRVLITACDEPIVAYANAATYGQKRADRRRRYLLEFLRSDAETPAAIVLEMRAARRSR